jgi:acetyl esterase/lipase
MNVREFCYKQTPQGPLAIHVHFPPDWKASDRRVGMVFFFGGGWTGGNVEQFTPQATHFASRGLVTARVEYRVRSKHDVTPDQCVEDARSAVRWLRREATELGIDPGRIVASGGSAGGHLAACTSLDDAPDAEGEDTSVPCAPSIMVLYNPVLSLADDAPAAAYMADAEMGRRISPLLHVRQDQPPAILFYGAEDKFFQYDGTKFDQAAKEVGADARVEVHDGQGHGFFNRPPYLQRTTRQADAFLVEMGYLHGESKLTDDTPMT